MKYMSSVEKGVNFLLGEADTFLDAGMAGVVAHDWMLEQDRPAFKLRGKT
jgi:hypothetical protein